MLEWRKENQLRDPTLIDHGLFFQDKFTGWKLESKRRKNPKRIIWVPAIMINDTKWSAPCSYSYGSLEGAKGWMETEWIGYLRP